MNFYIKMPNPIIRILKALENQAPVARRMVESHPVVVRTEPVTRPVQSIVRTSTVAPAETAIAADIPATTIQGAHWTPPIAPAAGTRINGLGRYDIQNLQKRGFTPEQISRIVIDTQTPEVTGLRRANELAARMEAVESPAGYSREQYLTDIVNSGGHVYRVPFVEGSSLPEGVAPGMPISEEELMRAIENGQLTTSAEFAPMSVRDVANYYSLRRPAVQREAVEVRMPTQAERAIPEENVDSTIPEAEVSHVHRGPWPWEEEFNEDTFENSVQPVVLDETPTTASNQFDIMNDALLETENRSTINHFLQEIGTRLRYTSKEKRDRLVPKLADFINTLNAEASLPRESWSTFRDQNLKKLNELFASEGVPSLSMYPASIRSGPGIFAKFDYGDRYHLDYDQVVSLPELIRDLNSRQGGFNPYLATDAYAPETLPLTWSLLEGRYSDPTKPRMAMGSPSYPGSYIHFNYFARTGQGGVRRNAGAQVVEAAEQMADHIPHGGMVFETHKSLESLALQHRQTAGYAKEGKGKIVFDGLEDWNSNQNQYRYVETNDCAPTRQDNPNGTSVISTVRKNAKNFRELVEQTDPEIFKRFAEGKPKLYLRLQLSPDNPLRTHSVFANARKAGQNVALIDITNADQDHSLWEFLRAVDTSFTGNGTSNGNFSLVYPMNGLRAYKAGGKIFKRI